MKDDSIDGIYDIFKICVMIFKMVGGIGFNIYCICVIGLYIVGINGIFNGIVFMFCVFNNIVCYVD